MIFLYVSDLHGDPALYQAALAAALNNGASLIVNGGDALPKNGDGSLLEVQREFLGWLAGHLGEAHAAGLEYFLSFGNDDCASLLPEVDSVCAATGARRFDTGWREHRGWHFISMPWVPDTPFLLKDWCLLDHPGWTPPALYGPPLLSTPTGFEEIPLSWSEELRRRPTIEGLLSSPPYSCSPDPERTVFAMHSPPAGSRLDVTWDGRRIGSAAGRGYIQRWKPPISLHGHVHESPEETGAWHSAVGETCSVNPGAGRGEAWVVFDTETGNAVHAGLGRAEFKAVP